MIAIALLILIVIGVGFGVRAHNRTVAADAAEDAVTQEYISAVSECATMFLKSKGR